MKPVAYLPQSKRLLEQVSEVIRYKHYSLNTEQAYLYWVRFFVRWCGRGGQMRHPRDMGALEVTQFLTMLANERRVSVSTHNQALSSLLFLYREVLALDLPWLTELQRPTRPRRIPSLLTKAEVGALLSALDGEMASPASRCKAETDCALPGWCGDPGKRLAFSLFDCTSLLP